MLCIPVRYSYAQQAQGVSYALIHLEANSDSALASVWPLNEHNQFHKCPLQTKGFPKSNFAGVGPQRYTDMADVNNDGYFDIIHLSNGSNYNNYNANVYLANGFGRFETEPLISTMSHVGADNVPGRDANIRSYIIDVDNDGLLDILYSQGQQGFVELYFWKGTGNGTFSNPLATLINLENVSSSGVERGVDADFFNELVDVNDDGLPDYVMADQKESTIQVWFNEGNGSFNADSSVISYLSIYGDEFTGGDSDEWTFFKDANQDGYVDHIHVSPDKDIIVWPGTGNGSFIDSVIVTKLNSPSVRVGGRDNVYWCDFVDISADGALDYVFTKDEDHALYVYNGDGLGGFNPNPSQTLWNINNDYFATGEGYDVSTFLVPSIDPIVSYDSTECTTEGGGPGGVNGGLQLWLRADEEIYENSAATIPASMGNEVLFWNDLSGIGNHANQTRGNAPLYDDESYSFPVINYNGQGDLLGVLDTIVSRNIDLFVVLKGNLGNVNGAGVVSVAGYGALDHDTSCVVPVVIDADKVGLMYQDDVEVEAERVVSGDFHIYKNSYNYIQSTVEIDDGKELNTTSGNINHDTLILDNYSIGGRIQPSPTYFSGELGEVILYDRLISALDKSKIYTYLAIKYGVTKEKGWFNPSGDNIWSWAVSKERNYFNHVAALAREDIYKLHRYQSKSIYDSTVVEIETTQPLINKQYLIWGRDSAAIDRYDVSYSEGSHSHQLPTTWKVHNFGDVKGVDVHMDLSFAPNVPLTSDIIFLQQYNSSDSLVVETVATQYVNNIATFNNIDFEHGSKFRLGLFLEDLLPFFSPDSIVVNEDTAGVSIDEIFDNYVIDPSGNFDRLNSKVTNIPALGEISSDSSMYVPFPDSNGVEILVFELCDFTGVCSNDTFYVYINSILDAPITNTDSTEVFEDTPTLVDFLVGDYAAEDGEWIYPKSFTIAYGTYDFINSDNNINYTPEPDFSGRDSIVYEVCYVSDSTICQSGVFYIDVLEINDAPEAFNDTLLINEDQPGALNLFQNDIDVENALDTFSVISAAQYGNVISGVDGLMNYIPNENYYGNDTIVYRVCDIGSPVLCDTATVYITIAPINDAPVAINDTFYIVEEDTLYGARIFDNDTDVDNSALLTDFKILNSDSLNGTFLLADTATSTFTYIPALNFNGTEVIEYCICDDEAIPLCDTAYVIIHVQPVNDLYLAYADTFLLAEDTALLGLNILANDYEMDADLNLSSFSVQPVNSNVQLDLRSDSLLWVALAPDFNGIVDFTYEFCEELPSSHCDQAELVLIISPRPDKPVSNSDVLVINQAADTLYNVVSNDFDVDGDLDTTAITIVSTNLQSDIAVTVTPAGYLNISYSTDPDYWGTESLLYEICDSSGLCDTNEVVIMVQEGTPPIAVNDTLRILEDTPFDSLPVLNLLLNDDDNERNIDSSSFALSNAPTLGAINDLGNGSVFYEPSPNAYGVDVIEYVICDFSNYCSAANLVVDIIPVADAPIAIVDSFEVIRGNDLMAAVLLNDNDYDFDLDSASIRIINGPASNVNYSIWHYGEITLHYSQFTDSIVSDWFVYEVCDFTSPQAYCDTARVYITILDGEPLVAIDDYDTLFEDNSKNINVLYNDYDSDGFIQVQSLGIEDEPKNGTAQFIDSNLVYTPNANYSGLDSIRYLVRDNSGHVAYAWVRILVIEVDDPIIAVDDTIKVLKAKSKIGSLILNDIDVDGDMDLNSLELIGNLVHGTTELFSASGELKVSYELSPEFDSTEIITYRICDLTEPVYCDTAQIVIEVGTGEPPLISTRRFTVVEDSDSNRINLLEVVFDPDSNLIAVVDSFNYEGNKAQLVTSIDEFIIYTPMQDTNGIDTVYFTFCDDIGFCSDGMLEITIEPVPDAPQARDTVLYIDDFCENLSFDLRELVSDVDTKGELLLFNNIGSLLDSGHYHFEDGILQIFTQEVLMDRNDTLNFAVCDESGLCDVGELVIQLKSHNFPLYEVEELIVNEFEPERILIELNSTELDYNSILYIENHLPGATITHETSNRFVLNYEGLVDELTFDTLFLFVCDYACLCDTIKVPLKVYDESSYVRPVDDILEYKAGCTTIPLSVIDNDLFPQAGYKVLFTPSSDSNIVITTGSDSLFYWINISKEAFLDRNIQNISYQLCSTDGYCKEASVNILVRSNEGPEIAPRDIDLVHQGGVGILHFNTDDYTDEDGVNLSNILFLRDTSESGIGIIQRINATDFTVDYSNNISFMERDSLIYEVCDNLCYCSEGKIHISIAPDPEVIQVYNGVSPNGDGVNEKLEFSPFIKEYPKTKLSIFNRWGDLVCEIHNYDNDNNYWDGQQNVGKESQLPDGTYFYKLEVFLGKDTKPYVINGFVLLQR